MTEYVTVWRDHEPTKLRWGVPVVRCRDCVYSVPEREPNRPQYKGALWCELLTEGIGFPVWPDCFCCWGKRAGDA